MYIWEKETPLAEDSMRQMLEKYGEMFPCYRGFLYPSRFVKYIWRKISISPSSVHLRIGCDELECEFGRIIRLARRNLNSAEKFIFVQLSSRK